MKKIIIGLVILVIVILFGRLNKYLSDQMYNDCMAGGKQSQETCEYYSNM